MKKIICYFLFSIIMIGVKSQIITTVVGNHIKGYSGDGGQATASELFNPYDVQFNASGNMYIADESNCVIRMVNSSGIIITVAGNNFPGGGYSGDGGPATAAEMFYPTKIAFDHSDNMYITDYYNWVVRQVNTSGIISTVAGNNAAGNGYSGDGGPATAAEIGTPVGVAFDALGNFYIGEYNDDVIRKVNTSGIISTVAGIGDYDSYSGDGGPATAAEIYYPNATCFDASGNLYISDRANNVIRMVNSSGIISTVVGNPASGGPLGGGYSGDGGPASAAELLWPMGIAFDASGNLFIADMANNVIREVNTSGIISTIVGNGQVGYSGDGGSPVAAELNSPYGIGFDASGNLYIADNGNQVIRKVTPPCTFSLTATVVSAPLCNGDNTGSVIAIPSGGSSPYTYLWSDFGSQTTQTATGLSAGNYTVNVTDNNGCSATASVTITQPSPLSASIYPPFNVSCNGGNNGSASANANGGTQPYTYSWSNGQTAANASLLSAGTYTLTVSDSCGASSTATVNITQPTPIVIVADSIPDNGGCNGAAWVHVSGGDSNYTYKWTGGNTTDSIYNQCYGYYCCVVTDAGLCKDSVCVNINLTTDIYKLSVVSDQLTVYPNPSGGIFTISFSNPALDAGSQTITIYNVLGQPIFTETPVRTVHPGGLRSAQPSRAGTGGDDKIIDISKQPNGVYFYRVIANSGKVIGEGKVVIQK